LKEGDHFSQKQGKPGDVREFYRCHGNVKGYGKNLGIFREIVLLWKIA